MASRVISLVSVLVCAVLSVDALAGNIVVPGISGGEINVRVRSGEETRFRTTVRQKYDYSCGSAALATLLTYHYGDPVSEPIVFKWMYEHGDREKIRRVGFSMLDMKKYLTAHGYKADGYMITLDQLAKVAIPAIVLVELKGYRHFVVVKGVTSGHVLVGDSATGIRVMPRSEFEGMWKGLVFVLNPSGKRNADNFNRPEEWRTRPSAPLGLALDVNQLSNITFLLPGPGGAGP